MNKRQRKKRAKVLREKKTAWYASWDVKVTVMPLQTWVTGQKYIDIVDTIRVMRGDK